MEFTSQKRFGCRNIRTQTTINKKIITEQEFCNTVEEPLDIRKKISLDARPKQVNGLRL